MKPVPDAIMSFKTAFSLKAGMPLCVLIIYTLFFGNLIKMVAVTFVPYLQQDEAHQHTAQVSEVGNVVSCRILNAGKKLDESQATHYIFGFDGYQKVDI